MPSAELQPLAPSLYELETDLLALLETEDMVPDAQRREYEEALQTALKSSVAKRDRVGHFLAFCETQEDAADREIRRLERRKKSFQSVRERVKGYVLRVILSLGKDAKDKYRKLEGETVSFVACKNPTGLDITDETVIPACYKKITVTLDGEAWQRIHALSGPASLRVSLARAAETAKFSVDRTQLKADLQSGKKIPGARLIDDSYRLEVR